MRLAVMLVVLAVCAPRKYRHIYVPKSSADCWRECKAIEATCNNRPPPPRSAGWANLESVCAEERKNCLMSCPGAVEEWRTEE